MLKIMSFVSFGLFVIKALLFLLSGYTVLFASALDSLSDSILSFINYAVHRKARMDPTHKYPYGFGGYEVLASLTQGLLLAGFGILAMAEPLRSSIQVPVSGTIFPTSASMPWITISVLALSAFIGFFQQYFLALESRLHKNSNQASLVIDADRVHYLGDVFHNLIAAFAVAGSWYFQNIWIDRIAAMGIGLIFLKVAFPILKESFSDILHLKTDDGIQKRVEETALAADARIIDVHFLRTRRFGATYFFDFHITLPADISLQVAHEISDLIMDKIKVIYPRSDILIHLDPSKS